MTMLAALTAARVNQVRDSSVFIGPLQVEHVLAVLTAQLLDLFRGFGIPRAQPGNGKAADDIAETAVLSDGDARENQLLLVKEIYADVVRLAACFVGGHVRVLKASSGGGARPARRMTDAPP